MRRKKYTSSIHVYEEEEAGWDKRVKVISVYGYIGVWLYRYILSVYIYIGVQ